jgi:head-tail adaptor
MRFGSNQAKINILRRSAGGNSGGVARGSFEAAFETFASWRQNQGREQVAGGVADDVIQVLLRVNNTAQNRTITAADRVELNGTQYPIASVGLPDRLGNFIDFVLERKRAG